MSYKKLTNVKNFFFLSYIKSCLEPLLNSHIVAAYIKTLHIAISVMSSVVSERASIRSGVTACRTVTQNLDKNLQGGWQKRSILYSQNFVGKCFKPRQANLKRLLLSLI